MIPAQAAHKPPVAAAERNRLRPADRAFHDWYRFVLSFPPHLVRDYAERFALGTGQTVLDPFCGTGTTLVECKKLDIHSVGLEPNPMAHFASAVKVDWAVGGQRLTNYAEAVAAAAAKTFAEQGVDNRDLPLLAAPANPTASLRCLPDEQARLLLKNSISPLPLHRTLVLLDCIDARGSDQERRCARLALARALVQSIGNLKFGPEVGVGKAKQDAPVLTAWLTNMRAMASDLHRHRSDANARVLPVDARNAGDMLEPASIDAVITSPPYPNEKDYTRTVRLESVILGLIRDKQELRALKRQLVRSNTRGVYKADTDDQEVANHETIQALSEAIERRRRELGKTSGFERLYPRVTQLYFGGMRRHLASLRQNPQARREAGLCGWRPSLLSSRDDTNRRVACRLGTFARLPGDRHRSLSHQTVHDDGRTVARGSGAVGVAAMRDSSGVNGAIGGQGVCSLADPNQAPSSVTSPTQHRYIERQ